MLRCQIGFNENIARRIYQVWYEYGGHDRFKHMGHFVTLNIPSARQ